jgi:hypothetical protein
VGINTTRLRSDASLQLHRAGREETLNVIGFINVVYCPRPDSFIVADVAVIISIRFIVVQHWSQQAGSRSPRRLLQLLRPDSRRQASLESPMNNNLSSFQSPPSATFHDFIISQHHIKAPDQQHGSQALIYTLDFAITSFAHAFSARIATTHIVLKSLRS